MDASLAPDSDTAEIHAHETGGAAPTLHEVFQAPTCGFIPCRVSEAGDVLTLMEDCVTPTTLYIPDGYTLDGAGHAITAMGGPGARFVGPIARNCGPRASYRDLTLVMLEFAEACNTGDDVLTGILYDNASGSISGTQLFNIRHGTGDRACQEGMGIVARGTDSATEPYTVDIQDSVLSGYQKAGIVVTGAVVANVTDNRIIGAGPLGSIVQAGIQLGLGATGTLEGNAIFGNTYTGSGVAAGILVHGGALHGGPLSSGITIRDNTLFNNDIGVYLAQGTAGGSPPQAATRITVVDNLIHYDVVTNGFVYQAAISDLGTGNIIHSNTITGAGYDPETLPGATFSVDVVAGAASTLVFFTPSRRVAVGACSGPLILQAQDADGNLSRPAETGLTLTALGPAAAGIQFFANANCEGPTVTELDIANAQAQGTFSFRAARTGSVSVFAWNEDLAGAQSQVVTAGLADGPHTAPPR
ncbi:hypothetical protein A176_005353 [Myxococcus hansupus]|uniref:Right handed beta helix domain-containing protein n=1 Tax=Pseudomyxococcus hansupus TaxID=1297742 RepID=A0A0H4WYE1_9BACT|nr:right-handed parallel beta-helix repeat-containing protein [Myxococcus hansupus]AKQ68441.1 hypothetical protein A176_005353 [Myxococcus hansupus]